MQNGRKQKDKDFILKNIVKVILKFDYIGFCKTNIPTMTGVILKTNIFI